MALYNEDGQMNLTVTDGSTLTGLRAPDGSYYTVINNGTALTGRNHPSGAINSVIATNTMYANAPNGSMYVMTNTAGTGYTPVSSLVGARAGLSEYLFYDPFDGPVASLNGRVPLKGSPWTTTGVSAADIVAGGGRMGQTSDTLAGYAVQSLTGTPKKISAKWSFDGGAADYAPTISLMDTNNLSIAKVLHGEGGLNFFFIRLLDSTTGIFLVPAWTLYSTNFTVTTGETYTTELYTDGKWCKIILKDHTGAVVGQEVVYDPTLASYVGPYMFAETFTTHMHYDLVSAETNLPADWTWPTLNIVKETAYPANREDWVNSVFGGTATWGSGKVTFAGSTIGQGGELPLAPLIGTLQVGDRIWFSLDASAFVNPSVSGLIVSTLPTNTATSVASNVVSLTGNGRLQGTLTITTAGALSFVIGSFGGGGADSVAIDNLLLIKNPPTTF